MGVSLLLLTLGAIVTFAIRWNPKGVDLDVVGVILMLAGAAGLVLNHYIWERRKEAAQMPVPMDIYVDEEAPTPLHENPRFTE
jgi:hypothetical protein